MTSTTDTSLPALTHWDKLRAVNRAHPWLLTADEKLFLISVIMRGDEAFPSLETLRHDMSRARSTVNNAKNSVVHKGWLSYIPGSQDKTSNHYTVTVPPYIGIERRVSKSGKPYVDFIYPDETSTPAVLVRYAASRPGEPSSTGCVLDTSTGEILGSTGDVLELVRQPYSKNKYEEPNRSSNIKNKPDFEAALSSSTGNVLEEHNPSTVNGSSPLADFDFPEESIPAGITVVPGRKITPYTYSTPKFNEIQYYRNDRTKKVALGPIENLPDGWGNDNISEFWLNTLEVEKVRNDGRLVTTQARNTL